MRTYVVQAGDSPAKIAIAFAGCPKCALDLVRANRHKPAVRYPNGFMSFKDLRAGETLRLPGKWFDGELDRRPAAYFKALPHPNGVTPSKGSTGVLGDYQALEDAALAVSAMASKANDAFVTSVDAAASAIEASVSEVIRSANPQLAAIGGTVKTATDQARAASLDLLAALQDGDQQAVTEARLEAQNALSTALGAAQIALEAYYAAEPTFEVDVGPAQVEPTFEVDVGPATIDPAPSPAPAPSPMPAYRAPAPAPATAPQPAPIASTEQRGISRGALVGLSLLAAAAVGGAIYFVPKHLRRRRRIRRVKR